MKTLLLSISTFIFLFISNFEAKSQLTGVYIVGGVDADYLDITSAVSDLFLQGGVGDIVFVMNSGTYSGHYDLTGLSASITSLRFESYTGEPTDVELQFEATNASDNYMFKVDGLSHVSFHNMTFTPQSSEFQRCILFRNEAHDLAVTNCRFIALTNDEISGDGGRSFIHCDQETIQNGSNSDNITITDCRFERGSVAIDLKFDGFNAHAEGLEISRNTFSNQLYTGINVQQCSGEIHHNTIKTDVGFFFAGIRCFRFDQGSEVYHNAIEVNSTGGATGIEYSNTQDTFDNRIYNNMVYVNSQGDVKGLAVFNLWGTSIDYNSVVIDGGLPEQSHAFHHLSNFPDGEDTKLRNNIFCSYNGADAFRTELANNIDMLSYTNLYSTGTTLISVGAINYEEIAPFTTDTELGEGCVNVDPIFPFIPDLHMLICSLDNLGMVLQDIELDFDSQVRSTSTPDMGADEFTYSNDPIISNIVVQQDELPLSLNVSSSFTSFTWSNGAVSPGIDVSASGTYSCEVTDAVGCIYNFIFNVEVNSSNSIGTMDMEDLILFPNPSVDVVSWISDKTFTNIEITSMDGALILNSNLQGQSHMDVSQLKSGVYCMTFRNGNETTHRWFIKN